MSKLKISQQVQNILKASVAARNSDKELLIIYMQKFGLELTDNQIALFRRMPSSETIRRVRQKIQEEGRYLADPEVEKARYEKFKEIRHSDQSNIEEVLEKQGYNILPWGQ